MRRLAGTIATAATLWVLGLPGSQPVAAQSSPTPAPPASPTGSVECVGCHGNPQIMAAAGETDPALYVQLSEIQGSVHSSFMCVTCHSALTSTMHAKRDTARASCAGCHTNEAELFAEGAHGSSNSAVPLDCVSCHGNHGILPTNSPEFRARMIAECSSCHTEMSKRFFGGNPFGMETHLGRSDVATCWDCHRAHLVLPVEDPRSPVNPSNILSTCRECHANAPPNFAEIKIHVANSPLPADSRLRAVTLYMLLILVGTFGFFGYHTILQIQHELRKRAAKRQGPIRGKP